MRNLNEIKEELYSTLFNKIINGDFKLNKELSKDSYQMEIDGCKLRIYLGTQGRFSLRGPDWDFFSIPYVNVDKEISIKIVDAVKKRLRDNEVEALKLHLDKVERTYKSESEGLLRKIKELESIQYA